MKATCIALALLLTGCAELTPRQQHALEIAGAVGVVLIAGEIEAAQHHQPPEALATRGIGPEIRP